MTLEELYQLAEASPGVTRGALEERARVVEWLQRQARYVSMENRDSLLYAAKRILKGEHIPKREDR